MLAVLCPHYGEAAFLIDLLKLERKEVIPKHACFINEQKEIVLMITSEGRENAAAASFLLLSKCRWDHLVVFGSCAGLKNQSAGTLYLVNKITDIAGGQSWYPDMDGRSLFPEAELISGDYPYGSFSRKRDIPLPYDVSLYLKQKELQEYDLYDLETGGYCRSAFRFLGPHQIHILRVVSDHGDDLEQTAVTDTVKSASLKAVPYLEELAGDRSGKRPSVYTEGIAKLFCCSVSMERQLKQVVIYAETAGIDWKQKADEMKKEGKIPCHNKEEGKACLNEFCKKIAG